LTGEATSVIHYHYTGWPDFGVPINSNILLQMVLGLRQLKPSMTVVHCSAGVGRTGTFFAMSRIMDEIDDGVHSIDVFSTVLALRKDRRLMVTFCLFNLKTGSLGSVAGPVIQATERSEFEDGLGSGDFVSGYPYNMSVRTGFPDNTMQTKFQSQRPSDVETPVHQSRIGRVHAVSGQKLLGSSTTSAIVASITSCCRGLGANDLAFGVDFCMKSIPVSLGKPFIVVKTILDCITAIREVGSVSLSQPCNLWEKVMEQKALKAG
jgi:hypothetical protein